MHHSVAELSLEYNVHRCIHEQDIQRKTILFVPGLYEISNLVYPQHHTMSKYRANLWLHSVLVVLAK